MEIFDRFNPWLLVAIGVVLVSLGALRFQIHRRRMAALRLVSIGDAAGLETGRVTGLVEVKGKVAPGKEGALEAPLSGKSCVWVRVTIDSESGPEHAPWRNEHQEETAHDFLLRDEAGKSLRVAVKKAQVRSTRKHVISLPPDAEPPKGLADYVVARGSTIAELREMMSRPGAIRAIEETIIDGDELFAAGRVVEEAGEKVLRSVYLAHDDIAELARSGKLFDGRARP